MSISGSRESLSIAGSEATPLGDEAGTESKVQDAVTIRYVNHLEPHIYIKTPSF